MRYILPACIMGFCVILLEVFQVDPPLVPVLYVAIGGCVYWICRN